MQRHHLKSDRFPSEFLPPLCFEEPCIIGIDEAGRGPVLGPLVYAVFVCPTSKERWPAENGANDSKQLTGQFRESFFEMLLTREDVGWKATLLHPEHISNCMLQREKINLNELSYSTVFELVQSLLDVNVKITAAFVDTLGKPEKYQASLEGKFPGIKFTVKSKADSLFPVVGAASIVAKVLRDDVLKTSWGIQASGYPGDAATVNWLKDNVDKVFGFPDVVRFSWSTCTGLLEGRCYPVRWWDKDETINDDKENMKKRSFPKPAPQYNAFGMISTTW